ncbi:uncharacterized protein PG998_012438 [Apiospora kogelbergensis]|uniref:Secreted protein n=1 Tax=Apiospora kogelbergensis TaxID=1337665 RepID=A0AAW0QUK2_9PEZI
MALGAGYYLARLLFSASVSMAQPCPAPTAVDEFITELNHDLDTPESSTRTTRIEPGARREPTTRSPGSATSPPRSASRPSVRAKVSEREGGMISVGHDGNRGAC